MLELVIPKRHRDLGGFTVGRLLPFTQRRMVGPFIFFDHMGPVLLERGAPRSVDVRPHPHIGLSTVTYLFEGEIMHRDSVGSQQPIRPGEVNWMTAGRGITHSERFEKARLEGGPIHAIQVWVALPTANEECEPSFRHHGSGDLPSFESEAVRGRLLAGDAFGLHANVQSFSPLFYLHWELGAGARCQLPSEHPERGLYVVRGAVEVEGQRFDAGQLLVFSRGEGATVLALTEACLMAFGGEPLGERFIEWNFVSSSEERIRQAKADWRAGRMQLPVGDAEEFIVLPPDPCPPPNPMS